MGVIVDILYSKVSVFIAKSIVICCSILSIYSCGDERAVDAQVAEGIFANQGEPRLLLSEEEREIFRAGEAVAKRRFDLNDGLGPYFNVTFCGACHEKPHFGGAAGHYRDFYLYGESLSGGGFIPSGPRSGVLSTFEEPQLDLEVGLSDPSLVKINPEPAATLYTRRNPIPFFGIGLLAEIPEEEILSRADPDDLDGDGVSGRPNYDQGYVGRFGLKAQTVSIENFIRGPLFNHLGITSNPLSAELQAALPVPSVAEDRFDTQQLELSAQGFHLRDQGEGEPSERPLLETLHFHQAAAPSEPLTDHDDVPDPELSERDLFALVSWAMLLAAPTPDALSTEAELGEGFFYSMKCDLCHTPGLKGPRGVIPAYTDLLLHDMGEELADGIVMALASGSEFRTQPLWGVSSTGPYLYDGRAGTLDEAVALHGGEASESRDLYLSVSSDEQLALISFLESLGGKSQQTEGLIAPEGSIEGPVRVGVPLMTLNDESQKRYRRGQALYDRDVSISSGLGPKFNGDSCRGCHFDPIVGGSGPSGVGAARLFSDGDEDSVDGEVMRRFLSGHGRPVSIPVDEEGELVGYTEIRQALPTFGLGIIAAIPEEMIVALEDPDDLDQDGVRGVARRLADGSIGRYGWRAQIASLDNFIADALAVELGMTIPDELQLSAAIYEDDDKTPDPEVSVEEFDDLSHFIHLLAPPIKEAPNHISEDIERGSELFEEIGCATCHVPKIDPTQSRAAYTDLLLHAIQPEEVRQRSFRTPPLWALSETGTYWHDGRADHIIEAVELHRGEATNSYNSWRALAEEERQQVLLFLEYL